MFEAAVYLRVSKLLSICLEQVHKLLVLEGFLKLVGLLHTVCQQPVTSTKCTLCTSSLLTSDLGKGLRRNFQIIFCTPV